MAEQDIATAEDHRQDEEAGQPFQVHVNNKVVTITGHIHTGAEIKEAAIAQGVQISADFVLSEELSHGRTRIVGDDERVNLNKHSRFEAIPNDDQS